jgi:hypothetical protein
LVAVVAAHGVVLAYVLDTREPMQTLLPEILKPGGRTIGSPLSNRLQRAPSRLSPYQRDRSDTAL